MAGIYGFKPAFRRLLAPFAHALRDVSPDTLSYAAVVVAAGAGGALYFAPTWKDLYLAVPCLVFVRLALNALDGMVAQSAGKASSGGEFVNEFSDRVSDVFILAGWALSGIGDPRWAWAALVVTLLVSYVGILSKAIGGPRAYAGPMGKADRMFLVGLAAVVAWSAVTFGWSVGPGTVWDVAGGILAALGLVTVGARIRIARRSVTA